MVLNKRSSNNNSGFICFKHILKEVTLLTCVALILMADVATAASWVKIWNNIGEGQVVNVKCYSSDSGLKSPTVIAPDQVYYFKLKGFLLRWCCEFQWENHNLVQSFVVWDHTGRNEMPVKCGQCLWAARPDGWWVWDKTIDDWKLYVRWKAPNTLAGEALTATGGNNLTGIYDLTPGERRCHSW